MAEILRNASLLRRSLFSSEVFTRGVVGTSFQLRGFAAKAKKKLKSDGSTSSGEGMSKKEIALQQALDQITTSFGKGSIMWLGRAVSPRDIPVYSTGSFTLDVALGVGGLPKGRVVEIYGPEASGKTTLALHVIAEAQKQGGTCVFVDDEHALDSSLAKAIGVNTENLLLSQPDCSEQALSLVDTLIRSGSVDVIVVDSVAALVPKGELEGEMADMVVSPPHWFHSCNRLIEHVARRIRTRRDGYGGGLHGKEVSQREHEDFNGKHSHNGDRWRNRRQRWRILPVVLGKAEHQEKLAQSL